jgi:hypothetical protein
MIDSKQILKNAPSNIGQQLHVNHVGCEAGNDTKRRLYIKRTDKGLVAYCHHCNESGFTRDNTDTRLSTWFNKQNTTAPKSSKPIVATLTTEGAVWLHKNYCDTDDKLFGGVLGEKHKVALTLLSPEGEAIGWQVRNLLPNATPKYITHYIDEDKKGDAAWFYKSNKTLVITEDYLSAYRVNKDTGYSSVALLRTSISDKTLNQIYELNFENIVIWLDPDEAGVKGTTQAYKKLNHFLPKQTKIAIYGNDKEPKECTPRELESILV